MSAAASLASRSRRKHSATDDHANVDVSTDPATGEALLIERNVINGLSGPVVEVVEEGAGTLTVGFKSTYGGVPYKSQSPGERVILLDAGPSTVTFTVVTNLATTELISDENDVLKLHGPHPSLSPSESEWTELVCGAMGP